MAQLFAAIVGVSCTYVTEAVASIHVTLECVFVVARMLLHSRRNQGPPRFHRRLLVVNYLSRSA